MIKINTILPASYANGPGKRFVIWTQGCTNNCDGCFNPRLKDLSGGTFKDIGTLFNDIIGTPGIEGISISGGEPFLQITGITNLVKIIKESTHLTVLIYTGYSMEEIRQKPEVELCLRYTDVLIAGEYVHELKKTGSLASSSNQKIYLISDAYTLNDFNIPESEVIIEPDGRIIITGINPVII